MLRDGHGRDRRAAAREGRRRRGTRTPPTGRDAAARDATLPTGRDGAERDAAARDAPPLTERDGAERDAAARDGARRGTGRRGTKTLPTGRDAAAGRGRGAAQVTVMSAFLQKGDHCVLTNCSYGGTNRAARKLFMRFGIEFSFVDFTDAKAVEAAIRPGATKLIFSETPANPTLTLTDLKVISAVAKKAGVLHCCDATFATPLMIRPLELGCDLSLHSTTKYFDGHNMTVGGCVTAKTKELDDELHFFQNMRAARVAGTTRRPAPGDEPTPH